MKRPTYQSITYNTPYNRLIKRIILSGLLLCNTMIMVYAEDEIAYGELTLEELLEVPIVSIATGVKQSIAQAPSVATVITAESIEAMGATELDEVLETVPGLHVARAALAYNPIYTIRGIHTNTNPQVLTLINGIPINTLYLGNRGIAWGGMPVNSIARIEIIRGPGSALYGADAFAGVINIITKNAQNLKGTQNGIRVGSFKTKEGWVLHGGRYGKLESALTLEYRDTEGQREIVDRDIQTVYDRLYRTHASLAPGSVQLQKRGLEGRLDLAYEEWRLRVGYQGRRNIGTGAGNAQALDPSGRFSDDRFNTDLTYDNPKLTQYWQLKAQLSYFHSRYDTKQDVKLYPPGAFGNKFPVGLIGNPGTSEGHTRVNLSGFYSGFSNHLILLGAGYHVGDFYKVKHIANYLSDPLRWLGPGLSNFSDTDKAFISENTRRDWNVFIQDAWKFAKGWELTAGLRYDDYSDVGSTVNPRLALVWETTPDLTSKLLYGRAFRAPAFYELYAMNNIVSLGNRNLHPEKMETWELAFNYRATKQLHLGLNLFTYKVRDIINFRAISLGKSAAFQAQNADQQKGYGLEWEVNWKPSSTFNVIGNYALQLSKDQNDKDAGNAPHHHIYVRNEWLFFPRWSLNSQVNWVADRKRIAIDKRPLIDDYATVDMILRYKDGKHWNVAAAVRNLFNTDAREPSGGPDVQGIIAIPNDLPLAGRNFFVEVRYEF